MSYLLLLPHIRIENANAVAGLTWGFPAITHFLGYVHALSRKVSAEYGVIFTGCAVISHEHHIQAYTSGRDYQFALTRNPLTKEGKTASFNEEGRMHLTVSLLVECQGEIANGEYGKRALSSQLKMQCQSQKLAGGSIVNMRTPQVFDSPDDEKQLRQILWRLMPGFALYDRSEWLMEHHRARQQHQPEGSLLDAWLDFAAIKYRAIKPEEGDDARWEYQPKPMPGYLVPLMCGYQRISRLYAPGDVTHTRDTTTPFAFAEAVYGVGEWRGIHRVTTLEPLFWRYHTTDTGYYCSAAPVADDFTFNDDDDFE
ncbi:type I-F CRISPR-associated protein Csy2 [Citrobacter amalonaticus]|uniref:Type I-F CRISPR-associated protein Csy2 n=1 Tax=Citrobacter amalonaticus TaxID=35703 RepID=A0A2S4RZA8_CITAM|nr:type I-F CRISPR-associated protein Csy2 [Citrobacter amalonaticus]POT57948.1 type I-F CRISPR-associated protein Csy2 [Citrobacter amalonaticus]POT76527.1 type I-F CRISPR-associated protein Csy2 [Citrobacter amalonaticus]POU66474.1 type I-F CRISPR-associated protein Csy2 [Citrobacter amalonaticus]POV05762.1 type I-F CRISPR-associated protein Csy2 [Citrobacter amalonaticus]